MSKLEQVLITAMVAGLTALLFGIAFAFVCAGIKKFSEIN